MIKIMATGIKDGKSMTVEIESKYPDVYFFLFNGERNAVYEIEMDILLMYGDVFLGGTYIPESNDTKLYAIMQGYFFDRRPDSLVVEGEIEEMPSEEGVIY